MQLKSMLATAATSAMSTVERKFLCSDGITLASVCYRSTSAVTPPISNSSTRNVLCLHGWLDNSASFHIMAPELVRRGLAANVVALDSPGHGMSSHKSPDCPQLLADYVFYVAEVAKQLEWDKFTVVGHSMGAAVSVMFASCFPEKVESLVLLDGFAPAPRDAHEISTHIRRAVETRLKTNQRLYPQFSSNELSLSSPPRGSNVYPNIEMAIEARIKTATSSPGSQSISPEAARALVERATIAAKTSNSGGVQFRHDPRLNWPSIQYLTREQVEAVLLNISCPVCLLMAADGWPIDVEVQHEIVDLILKPKMYLTLAGSHHLHADPDTAIAVVDNVEQFLNSL